MNYRLTIGLAIVLVIVAAVSAIIVANDDPGTPEWVKVRREFFWTVDDDTIQRITIQHKDEKLTWVKDRNRHWHFDTTDGEPVDLARWGGVTLLLSGPQFKRELAGAAATLEGFGLTTPDTVINVGFANDSIEPVQVRLGDKTPDGINRYAQKNDDPGIFLIDATWSDALSRLVTDPPYQSTTTESLASD